MFITGWQKEGLNRTTEPAPIHGSVTVASECIVNDASTTRLDNHIHH